ncbi:MAG: hypothetical protein ACI9FG_000557 [Crocinitomicaceae bacterium]|jgi:hypothetical protein
MRILSFTISLIAFYIAWWILGSVDSMKHVMDQLGESYKGSIIMSTSGWIPTAPLIILGLLTITMDLLKKSKVVPYLATVTLIVCFLTVRLYPDILIHLLAAKSFPNY